MGGINSLKQIIIYGSYCYLMPSVSNHECDCGSQRTREHPDNCRGELFYSICKCEEIIGLCNVAFRGPGCLGGRILESYTMAAGVPEIITWQGSVGIIICNLKLNGALNFLFCPFWRKSALVLTQWLSSLSPTNTLVPDFFQPQTVLSFLWGRKMYWVEMHESVCQGFKGFGG